MNWQLSESAECFVLALGSPKRRLVKYCRATAKCVVSMFIPAFMKSHFHHENYQRFAGTPHTRTLFIYTLFLARASYDLPKHRNVPQHNRRNTTYPYSSCSLAEFKCQFLYFLFSSGLFEVLAGIRGVVKFNQYEKPSSCMNSLPCKSGIDFSKSGHPCAVSGNLTELANGSRK